MARAVRFRSLTEKAHVRFDGSTSGNRGRKVGNQAGFSSGIAVPFSPWLRRRPANLSQRRTGVEYRSVHLGFMLPLKQILIRLLLFQSVSIIPPKLHSHLHLILLLPEPKTEKIWRPSRKYSIGNYGL
jgi:hypothetical protein